MQAQVSKFHQLIQGATQFVVPVFQRDYSWTEEHCERLWQDIVDISESESGQVHFLGSFVYIAAENSFAGFNKWVLIDGQQRLTTLLILLIAIRNFLRTSSTKGVEIELTEAIVQTNFLKNEHHHGERQYKLVLRGNDDSNFRSLLDGTVYPASASNRILENYEWFCRYLSDKKVSIDSIYEGINKLAVVDITLQRFVDNPQVIFECLNSTGLDLSQSDLIRNFVLMSQPESEQDSLYNNYWKSNEKLFKKSSSNRFDLFFRDYIALVSQSTKQENSEKIYFSFRKIFAKKCSNKEQLENMLSEIARYARYYASFCIGLTDNVDPKFDQYFARLRKLVDVPALLIMRLYDCYERHKTLTEVEFVEAIKLIESYIVRRAVCGFQTRGYWTEFAKISHKISEEKPLDSLKGSFALLSDNYVFPDDRTFLSNLTESEIYGKRVCRFILDSLENQCRKEFSPVAEYSVEHILPQNKNLDESWRKMLGDNWENEHYVWVHRLGNLTLTGYNSTYSDRPFSEKKSIENGFISSPIRLNQFVKNQQNWTAEEIEERGKILGKQALKIWSQLDVTDAQIGVAKTEELRRRDKKKNTSSIKMEGNVRGLFDDLSARVKNIDPDVIFEISESHSFTYHNPHFFLEVIPRVDRLTLLLEPEYRYFEELVKGDVSDGFLGDASDWKFIQNAAQVGGSLIAVYSEDHIKRAMQYILAAYQIVRN